MLVLRLTNQTLELFRSTNISQSGSFNYQDSKNDAKNIYINAMKPRLKLKYASGWKIGHMSFEVVLKSSIVYSIFNQMQKQLLYFFLSKKSNKHLLHLLCMTSYLLLLFHLLFVYLFTLQNSLEFSICVFVILLASLVSSSF